ncbi:MAG: hypothetical protein NTZ13_04680 [Candidatus Parcubacteria bacterium]|nr:hypothetical protein [Candidatus Parcubacteria bacterium]
MKQHKNIFISAVFAVAMILFSTAMVYAQNVSPGNIGYPIPELGNCRNQSACKDFCEKGGNMVACINFAEKKGMLSGEELSVSKIVAEKVASKQTPGGCTTKESCESFCQGKVDNINECIAFGEELGVIPASELAEAKKIASALSKGSKMPGACKTKNECESFCAVGSHIDECLNFAEAAGILPADQLAEARKVAPFLKNGETPGKCQTKDECNAYCDEDSHFDECIGFAEKAGFISAEDSAMAKKVGGKGPGGCKGKDECTAYCDKEENATACANFAKEKGLLTAEQEENINTGVDRMKAGLEQIPEEARGEIISCLENSLGKDKFDRIMAKQDMPTQSMGGKIEACFGKVEEIIKAKMMPSGGIPSGAGDSGSVPSKEEIMKNIPSTVPAAMREQIEKQIEIQTSTAGAMKAPPTNIPSVASPGGAVSAGMGVPSVDCSMFASVPSCDYVQGQGHDLCEKCKGG